ncbi:MAG TPA: toll/interleukin-1 receptor domain-containing protein [Pyrinomonadaceae bacterium]|jgi:hypothetical protein|nr:toll/interleukin-1 receptor domain-containing protein [Pyrinomonadaceae bacterium]
MMDHTKVFISYSHQDEKWLIDLRTHLKPLEREGLIELWDDTGIKAGLKWPQQIKDALATANVAVLLVSASFLASRFINSNELPALLETAKAKGTLILPIIVSACGFERTKELQEFQAFNPPDKPLNTMTRGNRDKLFKKVADRINEAVAGNKAEIPPSVEMKQPAIDMQSPEASDSFPENYGPDWLGSVNSRTPPNPPIHSETWADNPVKVWSPKFRLRRKYFVLPGLIGIALGLICGVVFSRTLFSSKALPPETPRKEKDVVIMVGSGTVLQYLTVSGFLRQAQR